MGDHSEDSLLEEMSALVVTLSKPVPQENAKTLGNIDRNLLFLGLIGLIDLIHAKPYQEGDGKYES